MVTGETKMLFGLRTRWTTSSPCKYSILEAICEIVSSAAIGVNGNPPVLLPAIRCLMKTSRLIGMYSITIARSSESRWYKWTSQYLGDSNKPPASFSNPFSVVMMDFFAHCYWWTNPKLPCPTNAPNITRRSEFPKEMVEDFRPDFMQSWAIFSGENLKGDKLVLL